MRIGSFVVLLLWVYYSTQIFLLGAEFTGVYAREHGSHAGEIKPKGKDEERRTASAAMSPSAGPRV